MNHRQTLAGARTGNFQHPGPQRRREHRADLEGLGRGETGVAGVVDPAKTYDNERRIDKVT